MSVPLYMDHHVHSGIAAGLRERGVDVLTTQEDGTGAIDDESLLQRATDLGRVLFTQDDDLLEIAHRWLDEERDFAGLAYAKQLGITVGKAIEDLYLIANVLEPKDMRNRVEFLPYP